MQMDKRCIKTEKAIRQAAIDLLRYKDLDKITVNDICEKAMISRNTFYGHYADKYLLLAHMSIDFVDDLMEKTIEENIKHGYEMSVRTSARLYFEYLSEHEEMVHILARNDSQFWQTFSDRMQELMLRFVKNSDRMRVFSVYSVSALIGCYKAYFEGELTIPPDDFVRHLTEITLKANELMFN